VRRRRARAGRGQIMGRSSPRASRMRLSAERRSPSSSCAMTCALVSSVMVGAALGSRPSRVR
jgi:hypothetical protein